MIDETEQEFKHVVQAYHIMQPLMGLRLPTTPMQYVSQDIPFAEHPFIPPPTMSDIPEEYSGIQRPLDEFPG